MYGVDVRSQQQQREEEDLIKRTQEDLFEEEGRIELCLLCVCVCVCVFFRSSARIDSLLLAIVTPRILLFLGVHVACVRERVGGWVFRWTRRLCLTAWPSARARSGDISFPPRLAP